jgi:broad specificity phosphatase PhoE
LQHLYFVRHGQTEWNAIARMQGQWNSDLSDLGRQQADVNGQLLTQLDIQAIYASPLDRTRQTTEIIQKYVPADAAFDHRIMEWDCGHWSGHLYEEVKSQWAEEWAALQADPFHYRGPGCENFPDMIERATPFVQELLTNPAENIAIVSHGMIGRVMIGIVMQFDEAQMLEFTQPNDVIYRVRLPRSQNTVPKLDHYAAGTGPHDGVVERW